MTTETEADCLFCKIVAGDLPADVVADTDRVVAFRDIDPQAPVHVLVVPKEHHGDVSVLAAADPDLLAEVVGVADNVAHELADGQYRFIFNSGPRAGQSVFHVHGHVLAGTQLGWSPA
ncbi:MULTISPECIES: histidine triad nucleotide-binding protein [Isoptericola]|uniref:Histidine triad nucleotide-binding protein n=1 Tax=Isoptericola haloaureus TaxID=1542902 RepID=A0ABU7ZB90_9MICO|nr:histidine triad nucleotide-binding protein [Isoptericola sp. AK164]